MKNSEESGFHSTVSVEKAQITDRRICQQLQLFDKAWPGCVKWQLHEEGRKFPEADRPHCTWDTLSWYRKSSDSQKVQLNNFLVELDKQKRLNYSDSRTSDISTGLHTIMESLCNKLEQLEPRFKGNLFRAGSFHNQTKIGEPDEFDFVYELDIRRLLGDESVSVALDGNCVSLNVEHFSERYNLFSCPDLCNFPKDIDKKELSGCFHIYQNAMTQCDGHFRFNIPHVRFAFFKTLNRALYELDLPEGWSHGGFIRPTFSGIRFCFPSFLIQLHYAGRANFRQLSIAVDFVPMFQIGSYSEQLNGVLEDRLRSKFGEPAWLRMLSSDSGIVFTKAEEHFLGRFPQQSVPKAVIRICKTLHSEAFLTQPVCPTVAGVKQVVMCRASITKGCDPEEQAMMCTLQCSMKPDEELRLHRDQDQFVAASEISETLTGFEYIPSYVFKLAVMTLMALDPSEGKSWTEKNIAELVLSVYMIINDVIVCKHDESRTTFGGKGQGIISLGEFSVPLGSFYGAEAGTAGVSDQNAGQFEDPPILYCQFRQALREGKCARLDDFLGKARHLYSPKDKETGNDLRLAQVFSILCSGMEGKSHALLTAWSDPRNEFDRPYEESKLLTKTRLASLM